MIHKACVNSEKRQIRRRDRAGGTDLFGQVAGKIVRKDISSSSLIEIWLEGELCLICVAFLLHRDFFRKKKFGI